MAIKVRPWEIGREVIFRPKSQHIWGGFKSPDLYAQEEGVIVEIPKDNVDVVVVKFKGDSIPRQAKLSMLSWKDD